MKHILFQLWIDRVCNVNLGFNKSICNNLTDPIYEDIENAVQQVWIVEISQPYFYFTCI